MYKLLRYKNLVAAFSFLAAIMLSTTLAHAQLVNELEANIPFAFSVDNTQLPAGEYIIHPIGEIENTTLQIENPAKNIGVFILIRNDQFTEMPKTSELTFDKIGNHYFLRGITVQDSDLGYNLSESNEELRVAKSGAKMETHKVVCKQNNTRASKS